MASRRLRALMMAMAVFALNQSCDDRTKQVMRQMEAMRVELAHLKAASANNTVVIEDLRNKVLLLEDQVDSTRLLLSRTQAPVPVLPVVKLTPEREISGVNEERSIGMEDLSDITFDQLENHGVVIDMSDESAKRFPTARGSKEQGDPAVKRSERRKTQPTTKSIPRRRAFDSRPIELYKRGFSLLEQKRHSEAIIEFERFLQEYPDHDYADNALYWMGEAYYDSGDFAAAQECFNKVVSLYPDGNKVPDSMLKSALCHVNQGNAALAREEMERLVATYPSTRAASIAKEKLRELH